MEYLIKNKYDCGRRSGYSFNIDIKYCCFLFIVILLPLSGNNSPIKSLYQAIFVTCGFIGFYLTITKIKSDRLSFSAIIMAALSAVLLSAFFNLANYSISSVADLSGFIVSIFLVILVREVVRSESRKKHVYLVFAFLVAINFALGIVQLINGEDIIFGNPPIGGRISGIFSWGAPVVGSYVGVVFPVIMLFADKKKWLTALVIIFSIIIILGGNRSMLIVDLLSFFFVMLLFRKHRKYALIFIGCAAAILVVSLPIMLVLIEEYFSANLLYRIASLGGDILKEQETKRLATWAQTACLINDNLFLGVGFGNYKFEMVKFLHCAPISEGKMPHPHHIYLDIVSSIGLLGSFMFISLISYIVHKTRKLIKEVNVRAENYLILLIVFSPLNVTHGFVSTWWSIMCFTMIGMTLANIQIFGKESVGQGS